MRVRCQRPAVTEEVWLEGKLQRQLDCPGVIGRSDGTKVARAEVGADAAVLGVTNPLRVVPNVEEFRSKLETGVVEEEVFEKRDIPIVAARAANTGMRFVLPGSWGWHGKDGRVRKTPGAAGTPLLLVGQKPTTRHSAGLRPAAMMRLKSITAHRAPALVRPRPCGFRAVPTRGETALAPTSTPFRRGRT
jgi:hypothetical protein